MKSNLGCVAFLLALQTHTALGQDDLLGADEMAEAIVSMTSRVWTGPRIEPPSPVPRPSKSVVALRSSHALVAVQGDPDVGDPFLSEALHALEHARARLDALGWPLPMSDGGLGGGPGLDLYVTASLPGGAYSDGLIPWTYLDRASTFCVLSPATPKRLLEACVTASYAEAMLLSAEPAEADAWRRATAAWLTWELTGRFGCEDAVRDQQAEPFRSWIEGAAERGAGGALWLAYLSARHDGKSGHFIRDVWALATQRTWEGSTLRADPDLWSALETAIERSGDRLVDNVEDLAVRRWFVGRGDTNGGFTDAIDADAQVPISRNIKRLPSRVVAYEPLQPFGSAYVVMNRPVWGGKRRFAAWLRGEYGVRWSFVALQLDESGNEIRRIAAPHTAVDPKAYLPIEIDENAEQLLFVVTNLSDRRPDADEPGGSERAFELIVAGTD